MPVANESATLDRTYRYQMSWRLILFGLAFSVPMFVFFGHRALTGTHGILLFRVIELGPVLSKVAYVVFSATGLLLAYLYAANALWRATGSRQIVVSSDSISVPRLFSRANYVTPLKDVEDLRLKNQGGRLECAGLNAAGKKLFRLDSWQFANPEQFADFVAQLQSRCGRPVSA